MLDLENEMENLCVENLKRADIDLALTKARQIEDTRDAIFKSVMMLQIVYEDQELLAAKLAELRTKVDTLNKTVQKHRIDIMTRVSELRGSQVPGPVKTKHNKAIETKLESVKRAEPEL